MPAGLLSPTSVLLCSTGFTSAYLGSIYLLPSTRIALPPVPPPPSSALSAEDADPIAGTEANPPRDRNHPAVIRARPVAVSVASLASCASLPLLLTHNDPFTYPTWRTAAPTALRLLGLGTRPAVKLILYPLGLTASLFAGSLYISWLAGELPGQRGARTWADWRAKFDGWRGIRTYILVRPPPLENPPRASGADHTFYVGSADGRDHLPELHHDRLGSRGLVARETRLSDAALVRDRWVGRRPVHVSMSRLAHIPVDSRPTYSSRPPRLGDVRRRRSNAPGPPARYPPVQCVQKLLPFRLDVGNLTRATTRDSLPIRVHDHLRMVRRIPVSPDRCVVTWLSPFLPMLSHKSGNFSNAPRLDPAAIPRARVLQYHGDPAARVGVASLARQEKV